MTTFALSWNPAVNLALAALIAFVFLAVGAWLAWSTAEGARSGMRSMLLCLRTAALAMVAILWLNPGRWRQDDESQERAWLVLPDRSASMAVEQEPGKTRWQVAVETAKELLGHTTSGHPVKVRPFATQLEEESAEFENLQPAGVGTDLGSVLTTVLDRPANTDGLVVVSDGRQTGTLDAEEIGRRARSRGVPVHVIPVGASWGERDLEVSVLPKGITVFRGQPVKINATVENRGLGAIKPVAVLTGPDGKEIARKEVAIEGAVPKNRGFITFELPESQVVGGDFAVSVETWPGEQIPTNNRETVRVEVVTTKTRVLLLEGAPHWDSKFLAQLLRQQGAVDILTVHRLNEERYFRVEARGAEPLQSPDTVFPRSAAELSRYDLIVFGKGADGFLDGERIAAVQGFVRDQGGAVLFARGKPYRGRFAPLEALENVEWGERVGAAMRFTPLQDVGAGLFGGALPGADDRVWSVLPPLEDVHGIGKLKPFTRVLAEGRIEGRETKVPLLVVRRFGRGMVATVNADGLWRWDFNADAKEHASVYQDFWVQLMQWCATYSDFRPGQDYAVRLRESSSKPGDAVRAVIAYRGPGQPAPQPVLKIYRDGKWMADAVATALPVNESGREWAAVVAASEPGRYEVRVADESRKGKEEGEAVLMVKAAPVESDDFRPDLDTLAVLAQHSGGRVWQLNELDGLGKLISGREEAISAGKAQWEPLWPKWWIALLVISVFGTEWWLRRREGLW